MKEEKTLSEIILECIVAFVMIIALLNVLSMISYSIELEENYQKETIRLQEEKIRILENIEEKIY